jgi:hypothetical protein
MLYTNVKADKMDMFVENQSERRRQFHPPSVTNLSKYLNIHTQTQTHIHTNARHIL